MQVQKCAKLHHAIHSLIKRVILGKEFENDIQQSEIKNYLMKLLIQRDYYERNLRESISKYKNELTDYFYYNKIINTIINCLVNNNLEDYVNDILHEYNNRIKELI